MQDFFQFPKVEEPVQWGQEASIPPADPLGRAKKYLEEGDLKQAERSCQEALSREPNNVEAVHLRGRIEYKREDWKCAQEWFQRATVVEPNYVPAWIDCGSAAAQLKHWDEASFSFERALEIEPKNAEVHMARGAALEKQGRIEDAVSAYRNAAGCDPSSVEPHICLAEVFCKNREYEDCLGAAQRALQVSNRSSRAYDVYGRALCALGQTREAISAFKGAIKLDPMFAAGFAHMAKAHIDLGQYPQALEASIQAVQIEPELTQAQVFRASALRVLGHVDEAMVACHKAILTHVNIPEVHEVLGMVYLDSGLPDEAAKAFERGLAVDPLNRTIHSNLLLARQYSAKVSPKDVAAEAQKFRDQFGPAPVRPKLPKGKVKKIGFISSDFGDHPASRACFDLCTALKEEGIKLVFYGYGEEDPSIERLKSIGDWRTLTGLDDETSALIISEDELDAVVDLTGHLERNRIGIVMNRPCARQLTWLGHLGAAATEAIDATLTDNFMWLPEIEPGNSQKVERLARPSYVFSPPEIDLDPGPPPCESSGYLTFGALCATRQINRRVVAAWAEILKQNPRSRLLIKARQLHSTAIRKQFLGWFVGHGVAPERIVCLGNTSRATHLSTYKEIDVCLDPFPWSGLHASSEAAWMGVPTLTWAGSEAWQRGAGMVMDCLGLADFIASSEDDYIRQAGRVAADRDNLRYQRTRLRSKLESSELCDSRSLAKAFVKAIERVS